MVQLGIGKKQWWGNVRTVTGSSVTGTVTMTSAGTYGEGTEESGVVVLWKMASLIAMSALIASVMGSCPCNAMAKY